MAGRRKQKNSVGTIVALSVALVACSAALIAGIAMMPENSANKYGCFEGVEAPVTAVFVDGSEPRWNEQQARSLRTYLEKLFDGLVFNERLEVYTTEGDVVSSVVTPRFHVCGQASLPRQLEEIDAPSGNAGYLKKQKQRLYDKVLAPELDALLTLVPDASRKQLYQSPVLEMIRAVSRELRPGDRLIVISDLLQNSDSMQACRKFNDLPSFSAFKKRSVYQRRLKPQSLEGVEVEVLMLQRYGYAQGELKHCTEDELQRFFEDYLIDNGVDTPSFIRIREGYTGAAQ